MITKIKIPPLVFVLVYIGAAAFLARFFPILEVKFRGMKQLSFTLLVLGLLFAFHSVFGFLKHRTTVNPLNPEKSKHLVVSGFYRFSRNPMYLGMLLMVGSAVCLLEALSAFVVLPLFIFTMNYFQIEPEELALTEIFGDDYLEYKRRVRRWI